MVSDRFRCVHSSVINLHMKIPQTLPQFNQFPALLVVAGARSGKVYLASQGVVELLHAYDEPSPAYSDNEGHFAHSGGGVELGSGAPKEADTVEEGRRFAKELAAGTEALMRTHSAAEVHLFAPDYMLNIINDALAPAVAEKVQSRHGANLTKAHPTELLERL